MFQIQALDPTPFAALETLSADALTVARARREIVKAKPGTPCRVSLEDAAPGEEVILVNHMHRTHGPFAASHAIYIRPGAPRATPAPGEVPALFLHRTLSLRAFSLDSNMIDARVIQGTDLASALTDMLKDPAVAAVDIHYAGPGCYAARAVRSKAS